MGVLPSTWGRGEGGSRTLAVLLWPALPTCSTPTVMTSCSEPSTFLSLGLVVVVVVAAVVEVAVVAVVAVVAMEVVLEEVLEEGEVMVLELGMGSVLVSRAMVVAVRGALVSRTEEREVGRVARAGFTWDSEVAGGMMAAVEVAASRRARNWARRAALRR